MATLAESFMADLADLSDESADEEAQARHDGDDTEVVFSKLKDPLVQLRHMIRALT